MKRMLFWLVMVVAPFWGIAQVDWDDFSSQDDFEAFQKRMNQRFDDFTDSINSRFAREIARQWDEFQIFTGEKRQTKPKPTVQPIAPINNPVTSDELPVGNVKPQTQPQPKPDPQIEQQYPLPQQQVIQVQPSFYRQSFYCECPVTYGSLALNGTDEKSVSAFWESLAQEGTEGFIRQCRKQINTLRLNDWGVYELSQALAKKIFPDQYNEQTVTTVFIVNQLGFNAKVGRKEKQLVCLLPIRDIVYSLPYLKCSDTRYYIFNPAPTSSQGTAVYTYSLDFPQAQYIFDMNIYEPMNFDSAGNSHIFSTRWLGETISVQVNKGFIEFYGKYPQVDLEVYANAVPDPRWAKQVQNSLSPLLEGRDEYEATAALLNFMHKSFPYAYDDEQFGCEKYFFCEENFYYKGSDCEDHAILFSYLVRTLVGLDVILLDYPDHVATAVHFNDPTIKGDYYMLNGRKYIVCDPTYFGASIGETIPRYKNLKPELIKLRR